MALAHLKDFVVHNNDIDGQYTRGTDKYKIVAKPFLQKVFEILTI